MVFFFDRLSSAFVCKKTLLSLSRKNKSLVSSYYLCYSSLTDWTVFLCAKTLLSLSRKNKSLVSSYYLWPLLKWVQFTLTRDESRGNTQVLCPSRKSRWWCPQARWWPTFYRIQRSAAAVLPKKRLIYFHDLYADNRAALPPGQFSSTHIHSGQVWLLKWTPVGQSPLLMML